MSYEFFIVETADHVSTVTLNRPDKLNALSHAMTTEFHVVLDGIEAQFPDVRARSSSPAREGAFVPGPTWWNSGRPLTMEPESSLLRAGFMLQGP